MRANPAAKDVIESNQAAASEQRQKAEEKEYLGVFPDLTKSAERATREERDQMVKDKELYYKLQNLEDHPGEWGLPDRSELFALLMFAICFYFDRQYPRCPSSTDGTI